MKQIVKRTIIEGARDAIAIALVLLALVLFIGWER